MCDLPPAPVLLLSLCSCVWVHRVVPFKASGLAWRVPSGQKDEGLPAVQSSFAWSATDFTSFSFMETTFWSFCLYFLIKVRRQREKSDMKGEFLIKLFCYFEKRSLFIYGWRDPQAESEQVHHLVGPIGGACVTWKIQKKYSLIWSYNRTKKNVWKNHELHIFWRTIKYILWTLHRLAGDQTYRTQRKGKQIS